LTFQKPTLVKEYPRKKNNEGQCAFPSVAISRVRDNNSPKDEENGGRTAAKRKCPLSRLKCSEAVQKENSVKRRKPLVQSERKTSKNSNFHEFRRRLGGNSMTGSKVCPESSLRKPGLINRKF